MTEYEIADLAASKVFELQGGVSLLQAQTAMIADGVQQYMSILFGYIAAAYFIGANLGGRQAWVFTTLYVMWQVWMISAIGARSFLLRLIVEDIQETTDISAALTYVPSALSLAVLSLLVAALFASLYFMWSVRHPKTE
jgi:hypothetical protein